MAGEDFWAALRKGEAAGVRRALDAGAGADGRTAAGEPALVIAAQGGNEETIGLLLDRGADADAPDGAGNTALMHAAARGHSGAIRLLLKRGADPGRKNRWGLSAGDWARWPKDGDVAAELRGKIT